MYRPPGEDLPVGRSAKQVYLAGWWLLGVLSYNVPADRDTATPLLTSTVLNAEWRDLPKETKPRFAANVQANFSRGGR